MDTETKLQAWKTNDWEGWSAALLGRVSRPAGWMQDIEQAIALAHRFNEEVVKPCYLQLDAFIQDHPQELPLAFIEQAAQWRLFSLWVPRMLGGGGWNFLSLYAFLEEVSSVCVGLANVIGVHYLGAATLMATWNTRLMQEIFSDVCQGERLGQPRLISLAITEPGAGTDMEETELLERVRTGTVARLQAHGDYLLDGCKVFISNGHVSTWHMVIAAEDRRRAADTGVVLAVHREDPGFSLGAHENKMGQKACVASELLFAGCRVPAHRVAYAPAQSAALGASHRDMIQLIIDYVVSSTRAGVAAFAAGVAQGSYRTAMHYAAGKTLPQGRLITQQWAQSCLSEMAKNAQLARQTWIDSACANSLDGLYAPLFSPALMLMDRHAPAKPWKKWVGVALRQPAVMRQIRLRYMKNYSRSRQHKVSGTASMAKFACSDLGLRNALLALELMGADGLRQDHGAEKFLRDAKLLQIYEGSNQLNRINYFKCSLRADEQVRVFLREAAS